MSPREEDPMRDYYKEWIERCDIEDLERRDREKKEQPPTPPKLETEP